jgi:bifunctional non-homologous end joining protein LigD
MKKCVWVRPTLVAQIEFLEWTEADHLRHSKFGGLREDKDARDVVIEKEGSC